jgi:hypothetical protein
MGSKQKVFALFWLVVIGIACGVLIWMNTSTSSDEPSDEYVEVPANISTKFEDGLKNFTFCKSIYQTNSTNFTESTAKFGDGLNYPVINATKDRRWYGGHGPFDLTQNDRADRRNSPSLPQRRDQVFSIVQKIPLTDYMILIRLEEHRVRCDGYFDKKVYHINLQLRNYVINKDVFNLHIGIAKSKSDRITVFVADKGKCWAAELPNGQDISKMYNTLKAEIEALLNLALADLGIVLPSLVVAAAACIVAASIISLAAVVVVV